MKIKRSEMAKMFDMSVLAPDSTYDDIINLCNAAKELGAGLVCVNP